MAKDMPLDELTDLLNELVAVFEQHLSLPQGAAEAIALWVLFAWTHDSHGVSPRLAFISPLPECGKTTALTILSKLLPAPMAVSNLTPATIYRALAVTGTQTFIIDEADTFFEARNDLAGILNSGHTRATAHVLRCGGDDYKVESFCTWAPYVIARIGELNPALKSRSIVIRMRRAKPDEAVERLTSRIDERLRWLHDASNRWAVAHGEKLIDADPNLPQGFGGRLGDNWRPLLAIADLASESWAKRARTAAIQLSGDLELPQSVRVLQRVRQVFIQATADRLSSANLCTNLNKLDDEETWTPGSLARTLRPFNIQPKVIRIEGSTPRGYLRSDFKDAFDRYLDHRDA